MAQAQSDYTAFTNRSAGRGFQRRKLHQHRQQLVKQRGRNQPSLLELGRSIFQITLFLDGNLLEKQWISERLWLFFSPLGFIYKHLHLKNQPSCNPLGDSIYFFLLFGYLSQLILHTMYYLLVFHLLACCSFVLLKYILDLQHTAWKEMSRRKCSAKRKIPLLSSTTL